MYISNLKLWNYRKYGNSGEFDIDSPDLSLNLSKGLNVLIGENDSGKSAIIDALKLVLKTHSFEWIKIEDDDFFGVSTRLRIEVILKDLSSHEAKHFIDWLGWDGEGEGAECFLRLILDAKRAAGGQVYFYEVKAGVDSEGTPLSSEAREYLKATYLRPLRDAASELVPKKNSRLSQILQGHTAFKNKRDDHVLVDIFKEFNTSIEKYFEGKDKNDDDLTDLNGKELKGEIDKYIQSFYHPEKESLFGVTEGKLRNILERLELSLKEVKNPGLGTLNKLFMSSELLNLKKANWDGLRVGLIEELEAHLHPQAQMQVVEILQKQKEIQLILTTHSPNLASKVKLENLVICNSNLAFPLGYEYTKLEKEHYKFLEKFLDVTKSNLFFAKGVILVEGWAEEIIIPSIAQKIGINLTEKGISVINVGNLGFSNYGNIFLRKEEPKMTIPVAAVTDVDVQEYEKLLSVNAGGVPISDPHGKETYAYRPKDPATVTTAIATKLALVSARSEDNVNFFCAPRWTLEYSLSKSSSLSEAFKFATKSVHSGTDWSTDFDAKLAEKLINKSLDKVEIAYRLASMLDEDNKENATPGIVVDPEDESDTVAYLINAIKYAAGN